MRNYNDLSEHKRADKVKWVITWFVLLILIAAVAFFAFQFFGKNKSKESDKEDPIRDQATTVYDIGGMIGTPEPDTAGSGISLALAPIDRKDYALYDLSPASVESAVTLTATFTPENVTNQTIFWSAAFANPASAWATGKQVSTYLSIADSAKQAVITCKEAFGEQIIVTATPESNPELAKTCTFDYVTRPGQVQLGQYRYVSGGSRFYNAARVTFGTENELHLKYDTSGTGTVNGEFVYEQLTLRYDKADENDVDNTYKSSVPSYGQWTWNSDKKCELDLTDPSSLTFDLAAPSECFIQFSHSVVGQDWISKKNLFDATFCSLCSDTEAYYGTFTLTYSYKYGETVITTGELTCKAMFDVSGLEVMAEEFQLSKESHLF